MAGYIPLLLISAIASAAFETEVHWVLCDTSLNKAIDKLEATVVSKKKRDVAYLDTPSLQWQKEGVTLRVRTSLNKIVSTVKVSVEKNLFRKNGLIKKRRNANGIVVGPNKNLFALWTTKWMCIQQTASLLVKNKELF